MKNNGEITDNYGFCCIVASTVPIESQRQYNDSEGRSTNSLGCTTDFKHAIASKVTDDILDTWSSRGAKYVDPKLGQNRTPLLFIHVIYSPLIRPET